MKEQVFDFKKALEDLKEGKPLSGKDGILTPLIKKLTEAALEAELDYHLNKDTGNNRRNGKSSKMMKSTTELFELKVPRERNGSFEPQFVKKYQNTLTSWRNNWNNLSHHFKYTSEIRKIMYTTNIIEAVHRQFRKLTKTKGAFSNEDSLLKLLYMGIQNAQKKWTQPISNWGLILSQLSICFENRLEGALKL